MAIRSLFFTILVLALVVAATPIKIQNNHVSLPLVKRRGLTDVRRVLSRDQARVATLKARSQAKKTGNAAASASTTASAVVASASGTSGSLAATNQAEDYVVSVGVGSPPTYYTLLVDTGSSNTWVGASQQYVETSTSVNTGDTVTVSYGSGAFTGTEFEDTVTLGDLAITSQSIGVATESEGFSGVDGIIGLGPTDLTEGTVTSGDNDQEESGFFGRRFGKRRGAAAATTIPTVTDNLFSQGTIAQSLVAISFAPATSDNDTNGEITFGATDSSKFTGDIQYVSLTTTSPASEYWGIDQSVSYGTSNTTVLDTTAGIVDTGTTLVLLASDAYETYMELTGATEDETTGLLTLSSADFDNLESLYFNIGSESYELTANAQIWPRSLNSAIGGDTDSIYLVVSSTGTPSGEGLDFINGYAFLERYYSVFDTTNSQVGFATTSYTNATTN